MDSEAHSPSKLLGLFPWHSLFLLSRGVNLGFSFHIPTENVACSCTSGKEFFWLSPAALLSSLWLLGTWQRQQSEDCKAGKGCNLSLTCLSVCCTCSQYQVLKWDGAISFLLSLESPSQAGYIQPHLQERWDVVSKAAFQWPLLFLQQEISWHSIS